MDYKAYFKELSDTCPAPFCVVPIEVNANYKWIDGKEVRVDVDCDAVIFDFTEKYSRYRVTVRVWSDSRVTVSIELKDNVFFDFPVTTQDEDYDKRVELYGAAEIKNDDIIRSEMRILYEWVFDAYRKLVLCNI